jgi:hypothetical protein
VRAKDPAGNTDPMPASYTWAVDTSPPILTVPADMTVEATGADGRRVFFGVSATDREEPVPPDFIKCSPTSGSMFPLGPTPVTCTATDDVGNTGSDSFTVTVRDTTPPILNVPADITVPTATDPAIAAFLAGATASDLIDPSPKITHNAPSTFPAGQTTVIFTAIDKFDNASSKAARVTVSADAASPSSSDTKPTANVASLKMLEGDGSVLFTWQNPPDEDFAETRVFRSPGRNGEAESEVYRGTKERFRDKGLEEGQEYRYVFVPFDEAGNRTAGVAVVVVGKHLLLRRPANGATLSRLPILFGWEPVDEADYYNFQVWVAATLRGEKKLGSWWPTKPTFQLKARWTYNGHRYRLQKGCYRWYVWPGIGAKSAARYGELLGQSEFCFKPKKAKKASAKR